MPRLSDIARIAEVSLCLLCHVLGGNCRICVNVKLNMEILQR